MSQTGWFSRAFSALVNPEPLARRRCLQASAALGAWVGAAGALLLFVGPPADWVTGARVQASVGVALLMGAALSWMWPPAARPYLLVLGVGLVAAVAWYPFFISQAISGAAQSGVKRFGHAPGVLAMGLAFGTRLLVDYGLGDEDRRRSIARHAGISGLVVGGCLDAFVLYRVMTAFLRG